MPCRGALLAAVSAVIVADSQAHEGRNGSGTAVDLKCQPEGFRPSLLKRCSPEFSGLTSVL